MTEAEQLMPIDIHYNKLPEWLTSRRHCNQQWQAAAFTIREKINAAIQDMPPVDEVTKLLQGTYINYFHCLRIVELLKETEAASKNIFGRYSSQRMKDWQEIVKLYEKDGVYLAEVAQLLTRNVNYEIPSLKRQIAKCQQSQTDCTRKESEYKSSSVEAREKFAAQCKQMGIEGKKIKSELIGLVKDLPSVFGKVSKSTEELTAAINYYADFVDFTLHRDDFGSQSCPVIKYVQQRGNTTVYEWRTGKKPDQVIEPILDVSDDLDDAPITTETADTIDFDICLDSGADGIDFGDENGIQLGGEEDIDWGDDGVTIEVVDPNSTQTNTEVGVARGADAFTILENADTRNLFTDELLELEAFLTLRVQEMQNGQNDVLTTSQMQSAPSSLHVDGATIQSMLSKVQTILENLTTVRMQHLFLIRSSPRYVDRLAENLRDVASSADKLVALQKLMVVRREEARQEQAAIEPKLDLIRQRTKELQKQIAQEISKKYRDRPVNIMGEINTV